MVTIRTIEKDQQDLWDALVRANDHGTYFHLFGWSEVIEKTYGLRSSYLGAFEHERLIAVLPATLTSKRGRRRKAVSVAFGTYGGWLIAREADPSEVQKAFMVYLAAQGVAILENRFIGEVPGADADLVTQRLPLSGSSEDLWKVFDPKVRNQIRKAQKEGLLARWGLEQLPEFFSIYTTNMHLLGTPPHPLSYFEGVRDAFPGMIDVLTIRLGETPLAAMFLMKFSRQLSDPWAASLREFASLCPNMLMYWEALKFGSEHGFDEFDFGRSKVGSGPYRFKSQWGAQPAALGYQLVSLSEAGNMESTQPEQSRLAPLVSNLWRYIPLGLSRRLGPVVRKYLV